MEASERPMLDDVHVAWTSQAGGDRKIAYIG